MAITRFQDVTQPALEVVLESFKKSDDNECKGPDIEKRRTANCKNIG